MSDTYTLPASALGGPFALASSAGSGYDAVRDKGKRQAPAARTRSEDFELRGVERSILASGTRNLQRNFSVAAWGIRRHLDYVSTFTFQSRTGDEALDADVEQLMRWWSHRQNVDRARRHSLRKLIRMAEARRAIDGDVFILERNDGRLQMIEGDRVKDPGGAATGYDPAMMINGVLVDDAGAAVSYAVHKRGRDAGHLTFERLVSAEWCLQHGYFDRYDQVRGISPLAPAVNTFRDVYENFDYALAKAKVEQLFAFAITRTAEGNSDPYGEHTTTADTDDDGNPRNRYEVDVGGGPIKLELDPGDDAKFLNSQNPSTQFQSFTNTMIAVALKALDIPFSFYDESFTTYSGSRQALLQYELAADHKREDNKELLDQLTAWRLGLFVRDGLLNLRGRKVEQLRWEWIPQRIRWVDPLKETTADVMAINAGLKSPQMITTANGDDWQQILRDTGAWQKSARDYDVALTQVPTQVVIQEPAGEAPAGGGEERNARK